MPRKPVVNSNVKTDEDAIIAAFDSLHAFKRVVEDMDAYNEEVFNYLEREGIIEALDTLYDKVRPIYRRVARGGAVMPQDRRGLIADTIAANAASVHGMPYVHTPTPEQGYDEVEHWTDGPVSPLANGREGAYNG